MIDLTAREDDLEETPMSTRYYCDRLAGMSDAQLGEEYANKFRDYRQHRSASGQQAALQFLGAVYSECLERRKPEIAQRAADQVKEELRRRDAGRQETMNQLEGELK